MYCAAITLSGYGNCEAAGKHHSTSLAPAEDRIMRVLGVRPIVTSRFLYNGQLADPASCIEHRMRQGVIRAWFFGLSFYAAPTGRLPRSVFAAVPLRNIRSNDLVAR